MDKANFKLKMAFNRAKMGIMNFITYSGFQWPKWNHVLIWVVGTALLSFFALDEFRTLLAEYKVNNEVTVTKIVGQNDTIKPPSIAFCLPRLPASLQNIATHLEAATVNKSVACPECEKLANHSWDVWTGIDTTNFTHSDDYVDAVWRALMRKLLANDDDSYETLSRNNSHWNQPLLEAVWSFFGCLTGFDRENPGGENTSCVPYQDSLLSDTQKIQNLFSRFMDVLCEHMTYVASAVELTGSCPKVLTTIPSVTFTDGFCFLFLVKDEGSTHLTVDAKSKEGRGVWPALNVSGGDATFDVFADSGMITWPTGNNGDNHALYLSESLDGGMLTEQVSVKYLINMVVAEKKDIINCYKESTPDVCVRNCMLKKIIRLCQCVPFTFRNAVSIPEMSQNLSYCNSFHYAECRMNMTTERESCDGECVDPCEYISYQWHVTRIIYNESNWRKFRLFVAPVRAPFIQFNVTERETTAQFTSRVAAIFNLYLGFSGLSLLVILSYVSDLFKTWLQWKAMARRIGLQSVKADTKIDNREKETGQQGPRWDIDNEKALIVEIKHQMDALVKQVQALKSSQHYQYMKHQAMVQKSINKASVSLREDMDHLKVTHKTIMDNMRVSAGTGFGDRRRSMSLTLTVTRNDCGGR